MDDESFIESARVLFSQSTDALQKLLESLESNGTLFSTAHVATLIEGDIGLSERMRISLVHIAPD
jgi:hypothetical protein